MKKIHRFFTPVDVRGPVISITDRDLIHQMRDILHLTDGEEVLLCDGSGQEALVVLEGIHESPVGRVKEVRDNTSEPPVKVTLFCAVLKGEHFELVVQKCVELGVYAIVPVITDRTIKLGLKMDRLEKIAKEAAEVAGRGMVPVVENPISFKEALNRSPSFETTICFDIGSERTIVLNHDATKAALFVGPEGGWSEEEQSMFTDAGCQVVTLGPRTLRGETAAIVGTAIVMGMIEGWG